jgi:hypothetical protein
MVNGRSLGMTGHILRVRGWVSAQVWHPYPSVLIEHFDQERVAIAALAGRIAVTRQFACRPGKTPV